MSNPLEDYVLDRLRVKMPSTELVRYTDFSWGGKTVHCAAIHGKTYKELVDNIEKVTDSMIKDNSRCNDTDLIGVRITKHNIENKENLNFYLNLYFGDIQGGDQLYYKLKEEFQSRQK